MVRLSLLALATLLCLSGSSRSADPLDCIPASARAVVVVDRPRTLAEAALGLDAFRKARELAQFRAIYDSPSAQRLLKFLAFAERELGAKWPQLLDGIAGNGLAIGIQFGADPSPAIAAACGTDAELVKKAFELAVKALDEEFARQGSQDRVELERVDRATVAHFGRDIHFAELDGTVVISNGADYLKEGLALARSRASGRESPHAARRDAAKILPKSPLVWGWFNFAAIKESKEAKDFFDATRQEFIQTLGAGTTIDCLRRSEFVAAGLYREASGLRLSLRLPAGREGLWSDLALHVPAKGSPGSLPLLEPPGAIYSQSFHLDVGYMWKHRDRMITGDSLKQFEKGEKEASKFLPTDVKLGELLELWGPYHRIVVANHDRRPYSVEPELKLPAFGYVATMRDPKFGDNLQSIFRAVALLGTLQYGLKSSQIEFEGIEIAAYRFSETKVVPDDARGLRFNFEPCFAIVGSEVVVASTVELAKKLIVELKKPKKAESAAVWQARGFAAGSAEVLAGLSEPLITDAVLGRGVCLSEARTEVADLVAWVRTLGSARIELDITANEYRLDAIWEMEKR